MTLVKNLVPTENNVLLLDNEDHMTTSGGIVLATNSQHTHQVKKLEILCSNTYKDYIGMKAIVNRHSGVSFTHNGEKYVIVSDREILGIVNSKE